MTEPTISLSGVFPPIPTPFNTEGDVAAAALRENLERWNEYDLSGYVVLGSNGEGVYLTDEEKEQIWEVARQAIPPEKLLIAGTGCESTRQTIELSLRAANAGADAVLVLTPHYYGGQMTPDILRRHFETVADRVPVPVVIYNMPRFTHVDMVAETVISIAQHPNVIGIKDSSGNVGKLAQIVGTAGDGFQILAGSASFFFPALTVGAAGAVMALANIAPQALIDLYHLFERGDWDEAAATQQRLVPVNTAITARFGIAGLKAAMDLLGYYGGPVRSPLRSLGESETEILKAILVKGQVL
jgi:4-hydroxy-2-oxoglutarate aldolase